MKRAGLKNLKALVFAVLMLTVLSLMLFSCSAPGPEPVEPFTVKVLVEDGEHFRTADKKVTIEEGADAKLTLLVDEGYYFDSCSYENYTAEKTQGGIELTLGRVLYDTRLKVNCKQYPVITLERDPAFTSESYEYTVKNGELSLTLNLEEDKTVVSCSYADSSFFENGNSVTVLLKNISASASVSFVLGERTSGGGTVGGHDYTDEEIQSILPEATAEKQYIFYSANGGEMKYSDGKGYYKQMDMTNHLRPNTDRGTDYFTRDGYQLTGWNTKRDGTGLHIGLGSKITPDGTNCVLFTEWTAWSEIDDFKWETVKEGSEEAVKITGYVPQQKDVDSIVIPDYIDGKPVTVLGNGFLSDRNIGKLYFPLNLRTLEKNGIKNCSIDELHMYDAFAECEYSPARKIKIKSLYINAVEAPRYMQDEFSHFPDSIDRLIMTGLEEPERKRMIFFGGCAMSYGLVSSAVEEQFPEYTVCDMGVIGGTNASFQMDAIARFVKEGDVFIHAPETMSEYQLFAENRAEIRMFRNVEVDYDLLTYTDLSLADNLLEKFAEYHTAKMSEEPQTYSQFCDHYNEYGDIRGDYSYSDEKGSYDRTKNGMMNHIYEDSDIVKYNMIYATEESLRNLENHYDMLSDAGAEVIFSLSSPINTNSFTETDISTKSYELFEDFYRSNMRYPVISSPSDYQFTSEWFFDKDYHLNFAGAQVRTDRLIQDIKDYFSGKEKL